MILSKDSVTALHHDKCGHKQSAIETILRLLVNKLDIIFSKCHRPDIMNSVLKTLPPIMKKVNFHISQRAYTVLYS